jgi:hypothetical protein
VAAHHRQNAVGEQNARESSLAGWMWSIHHAGRLLDVRDSGGEPKATNGSSGKRPFFRTPDRAKTSRACASKGRRGSGEPIRPLATSGIPAESQVNPRRVRTMLRSRSSLRRSGCSKLRSVEHCPGISLKRCGTGKGSLTETRSGSVRPPGLRIKRAEV